MKDHKHNWELSHTTYEYQQPQGMTTTLEQTEYAYLLCQCGKVKKVEVEEKS